MKYTTDEIIKMANEMEACGLPRMEQHFLADKHRQRSVAEAKHWLPILWLTSLQSNRSLVDSIHEVSWRICVSLEDNEVHQLVVILGGIWNSAFTNPNVDPTIIAHKLAVMSLPAMKPYLNNAG